MCSVQEIGLRNGTLDDCSGCPYTMCIHFGEKGECFYGGVMSREVYPAVRRADGVVMLCPNYNDALSANLTAFINRLTALFRQTRFYDKALFALVVSGYSGSDLVARQLISAMNMNKSFYVPDALPCWRQPMTQGRPWGCPESGIGWTGSRTICWKSWPGGLEEGSSPSVKGMAGRGIRLFRRQQRAPHPSRAWSSFDPSALGQVAHRVHRLARPGPSPDGDGRGGCSRRWRSHPPRPARCRC